VPVRMSLKRAHELAAAVGAEADRIEVPTEVSMPTFGESVPDVEATRARMRDAADLQDRLIAAQYAIREAVDAAHAATGIRALLARRAGLDARAKALAKTVQAARKSSEHALSHQDAVALRRSEVERARAGGSGASVALYGGGHASIEVRAAEQADVKAMDAKLKGLQRERAAVSERLAALHLTNEVDIPEDAAALLREVGLLD